MRPLLILALVLPLLALPAAAADKPTEKQTVDQLFEKLYETQNPIEAQQLERKIWEAWADAGSDTLDALMKGGMTVMEKGDHERAEQIFTTMIELQPDFAEAYNKRATVRFLAGDYAGSVADIERTLQLEPRHFGALSGLGTIMERLDNLEEALRAYRRALAANPHLADAPEKLRELQRRIDAREI